tara:strand:- start:101 stop:1594 length:1494 start_codon:yes stop_codon:yes gene_type:complete
MAKKTRTELSTLAINTNLPDNTTELITPTTERAQLTDERESVVNYKDDLGGVPNAGKFLTVAVDGESLTMVDEPSGVPDWVTFVTALSNLMKLKSGTNNVQLQFYDSDGTTVGGQITWNESNSKLLIVNSQTNEQISMSGGAMRLTVGTSNILIDSDGVKPSLLWSSIVRGYEGGSIALSTQPTGGALTPRLEISSGGDVGIGTDPTFGKLEVKVPTGTGVDGDNQVVITDGVATNPQEMRLGVNTASNYSYIQSAHRASAWADLVLQPIAGNVGIGTDSPIKKLQVSDSVVGDLINILCVNTHDTNGDTAGIGFSMTNTNLYNKAAILFERTTTQGRGDLHFAVNNTASSVNVTKADAKLTIGSNWTSTLDAYKEGTWTPTIGDLNNISSVVTTQENYTVIGNLVTCAFDFSGTIGSSSSETYFSFTTPFTMASTTTPFVGHVGFFIGTGANRFGVASVLQGTTSNTKTFIFIAANQINTSGALPSARMTFTYQRN